MIPWLWLIEEIIPDPVEENLVTMIAKIGEKITLGRSKTLKNNSSKNYSYLHTVVKDNLSKLAVIVTVNSNENNDKVNLFGKQLAMHIAASNPISLNLDGLDPKIVNKEKKILVEQAISSGKPKDIAEKMVEGRIRKFCEDVVLLEQTFVIDGKSKIKDVLKQFSKEQGVDVSIDSFKILILGQGIEVEEKDFAAEVAATANN